MSGWSEEKATCTYSPELAKRAEAGDADAQFHLARCYLGGKGVAPDEKEAVKWFDKSAAQGNAGALYAMGLSCIGGVGRDRDDVLGVYFLRQAAEKKWKEASVQLAQCYWIGVGVPKNEETAISYAKEGLDNANPESMYWLGRVTYLSDAKYSFKLFMDAALSGHPPSMHSVALGYYMGCGVIKNYEESLKWSYITQANASKVDKIIAKVNRETIRELESSLGPVTSASIRNNARLTMDAIDNKRETDVNEYSVKKDSSKTFRTGSGVLVSKNGLVVTAAHVVADCKTIQIITGDMRNAAKIVAVDEKNDVALLQADGGPYEASPLDMSGEAQLGARVFTVGFPHVDIQGTSPKMTRGEISSNSGMKDDPTCWQVSVPVQMGNSGGGLFDDAGNVIGVIVGKVDAVTSAMKAGDSFQNVNYAVKGEYLAPMVRKYSNELISPKKKLYMSRDEDVVNEATKAAVIILAE